MTFSQLLARQRRPEIGIALTHQRHRARPQIDGQFAVAGLATPRRDEPGRSGGLVAPHQPADLTLTQLQPFSRQYDRQAMPDDRLVTKTTTISALSVPLMRSCYPVGRGLNPSRVRA